MNNTLENNYFKIKTLSEKRKDFHYTRHPLIQIKHPRDKIDKECTQKQNELNQFFYINNVQKISLTEKKQRTVSVYNKIEKKRRKFANIKKFKYNFLDKPQNASFSINPLLLKNRIHKKITDCLKKNEKSLNEIYSDKQFVTKLLYPNYNIDLILENDDVQKEFNKKTNHPLNDNKKTKVKLKNFEEKRDRKSFSPSYRTNFKKRSNAGEKLEKLLIEYSRATNLEDKQLDYSLLI